MILSAMEWEDKLALSIAVALVAVAFWLDRHWSKK